MRHIFLIIIALFLLAGPAISAELVVRSDFEGGSAEVVSISTSERKVTVRPALKKGRGFPCWWYFRLTGLDVGESYQVTTEPARGVYRQDEVLAAQWSLPDQAAISFDDQDWKQTSTGKKSNGSITYQFQAESPQVWLAWGPPFLPSTAEQLLNKAKAELPEAEIFELSETRQQRPVKGIRFGAVDRLEEKPFGIWVQARQHAWEAGGSWVGQGFLQWAISDEPAAVELRSKSVIHFVPIMDVDNVADGAGGKNAFPRDHNRDWDDRPVYPEVRAAQERIKYLDHEQRFDLFIDLHNPGASEKDAYFFGPNLKQLSKTQRQNYDRLLNCAVDHIGKMKKEFLYPSYVKDDEEYNRMSGTWVINHTAEHVVSVTLETGWNRPEGNQLGYQQVGAELGQSIGDYFQRNPREVDADSK
ncbi:Zinc carboxypeptidase [Polystyrenella longa]|uniref:Zinc carboxypeptidase n=1 Tax=Polystyrenella longa TaxID=2528007 RepID=A0A518CKQ2_9PLAN|nr:M14-type cytosolic carboxypeptidase [Polystyrenella longa]QDU79797.1 Zinc carboxypeptidase [Polystyrenella longa]